MQQYTTQLLLPRIEQRIVDIEWLNYTIPVASNKRSLRDNAKSVLGSDGLYHHVEDDYADARTKTVAKTVERVLVEIIDHTQLQTLSKLNDAVAQLLDGKAIATAKLKSLLTSVQFVAYETDLTRVHHSSEILYGDGMPSELKEYNLLLNKADLTFNKYEKMAGMQRSGIRKYKMHVLKQTEQLSEHLYERALERLEEIFDVASVSELQQLKIWMDRDVMFGPDGETSIDCEGVPRVRGSKSYCARDAGLPKLSKRLKREMCMLIALRDAASEIAFEHAVQRNTENSDATQQLMRDKISKLMKSKR